MRTAIALLVLGGCLAQPDPPVLRIEPSNIQVELELGVPVRTPVKLFADDVDVTDRTTLVLDGKPLGSVDTSGFTASGSVAGHAQLLATFDGRTASAPVHVSMKSRRFVGAPPDSPEWFRTGNETVVDAALEPGDGAMLPPNVGGLEVNFAADDFEDVHEVAFISADVDVRIYATGAPGPRTTALTAAEWYAIAETNRGGSVELQVRSTRIITRENVHTAKATLRIADLAMARELLFTGRSGTEMPQMWSYTLADAKTYPWNPQKPAGACIGCHVALSKDGRRIAAGGNDGTTGGGIVLDAWTRQPMTPFNAGNNWTSATYDKTGGLLTTNQGQLAYRDGTDGTLLTNVVVEAPANQPAMSNTTGMLAYVSGPIDPVSTQPVSQEIRVQGWSPVAMELTPGKVLVPAAPGDSYKLPEWSPDDQWLMYTRVRGTERTLVVRPTDGRLIPTELVRDADFGRFASGMSGGAESYAWIIMKRSVPVGVRNQDQVGQLWAAAWFPDRGVVTRPFHLPGQRPDVAVLHAPLALP